jgi:hypothetical protein
MVQLPLFNRAFCTKPLSPVQWLRTPIRKGGRGFSGLLSVSVVIL